MIPFSEYKELLGAEAEGMTDEQIKELRDDQYAFAQLAFDSWLKKKQQRKI